MIRRPPRSTRTDTLFPSSPLFRSKAGACRLTQRAPRRLEMIEVQSSGEKAAVPTSLPVTWTTVAPGRSEEYTSELQSLMRIWYAVVRLKKKKQYQKSKRLNSSH